MVELRRQLSRRDTGATLASAAKAVEGAVVGDVRTASPARVVRRWRLVDRLGEQIIRELVADRRAGATKQGLAERYNISLSGVKQILKREVH